MKKFIIAALAASVLATPVLAAPYQGQYGQNGYDQRHDDRGRHDIRRDNDRGRNDQRFNGRDGRSQYGQNNYRSWRQGERFDRRQAYNYRIVGNPRAYHLRDAPRGYRWVQSGNDAVLIGITSGIIASVLANSFR
jgi:Ni/Co efflux regulator RcnB